MESLFLPVKSKFETMFPLLKRTLFSQSFRQYFYQYTMRNFYINKNYNIFLVNRMRTFRVGHRLKIAFLNGIIRPNKWITR
jgi:hypothetical protein